jgi:type VI secretion system secreted protein Hcp
MAIDVYLQIDGIQGESTDSAHQGWIKLSSAQSEVESGNTAGGWDLSANQIV